MSDLDNRRPISARDTGLARRTARVLATAGISANAISAASVVFATLAAGAILAAPHAGGVFWLLAVAFIGLRLLANLFDGMVAVEHGKATSRGPIWNELPDRVSDVAILAAAGYSAATMVPGAASIAIALGWICAVGAVLTAYVRELGRALETPADFGGPFAKQQRMTTIAAGCLISLVEPLWSGRGEVLLVALAITAVGTLLTVALRTRRLAIRLGEK